MSLSINASTGIVGTLNYMAPELFEWRGEISKLDFPAADIWAVGAMAFYLMTKSIDFPRRRQAVHLGQPESEFLPGDCQISLDGLAFMFDLTSHKAAERPRASQILQHTWLKSIFVEDSIPEAG